MEVRLNFISYKIKNTQFVFKNKSCRVKVQNQKYYLNKGPIQEI